MSKIEELKNEIIEYFEENEEEFNEVIEDLDSWCGYLGDGRYEDMEFLNEIYCDTDPLDILYRAFYGHDDDTWHTDAHGEKEYGEFNPNRNYFYFNGYGNLVSTDFRDYSSMNDIYFVEKLIAEANHMDSLPEEVAELIRQIEEEERKEEENV